MYNKILIPVDMSHPEKADAMIAVGKKLAGADAQFIMLNVTAMMPAYLEGAVPQEYLEISREQARKVLGERAENSDIEAKIEIRAGKAEHEILSYAEDNSVDLIIVGSHKPDFGDYLIGSTAARVVRHAKCPVMVLR